MTEPWEHGVHELRAAYRIVLLFWARVDTAGGPDACWPWRGTMGGNGYGNFSINGKKHAAHRVAYELATGETINAPMELDHICRNRYCVNPRHLRPVTRKQNNENYSGAQRNSTTGVRGVSPDSKNPGRWRARVTHNGRAFHLGSYASIEDAEAAVRAKRLELFTHNELDKQAEADAATGMGIVPMMNSSLRLA
jgi:HNH endonuclease